MIVHSSPRITVINAAPADVLARLGPASVDVVCCGGIVDTPRPPKVKRKRGDPPKQCYSPYSHHFGWADLAIECGRYYARKGAVGGRTPGTGRASTPADPWVCTLYGLELVRAFVEHCLEPGDLVLDLHAGETSGALGFAALDAGASGVVLVCEDVGAAQALAAVCVTRVAA